MDNSTFTDYLNQKGWDIQRNKINTDFNEKDFANGRFANATEEIISFIRSFDVCVNEEDNIWFLSHKDYYKDTDAAFPWNEFENQSLESADANMIDDIKKFWTSHLPILMTVKNGYQYVAIGIGETNKNKFFYGIEPEYEEVTLIANSFTEFKERYCNALDGNFQNDSYKSIV